MKKKLLLFVVMLSMLACMLAVTALAVEVDGIYYSLSGSGENAYATVTAENRDSCTLADVVIPATITVGDVTYKVTEIAKNAFGQVSGTVNGHIKSLVIGANVSAVGEHAFRNITTLQTVKIENTNASSPISFHNAQFYNCTGLVSVEAKNARIKEYGDNCFWLCKNLVTVEYPPMLERIGQNCFRQCDKLTTADLTNTQVTEVAAWGFGVCYALTSIKFPSTLTSIGNNVFLYCPVETYVFPHKVNYIGADTLAHQSKIKVLVMPEIDETHNINTGFLYTTRPNVIIYPGDNVDFFKNQFSSLSAYDVQPFENYVPGTTYAKNTIFYGADTCQKCNGLVGEREFVFTSLAEVMKDQALCTNCGAGDVTTYPAVFTNLGYSKFDGTYTLLQGFAICKSSLELYTEKFPEQKIEAYGLLAVAESRVDSEGTAFNSDGTAKAGVNYVKMSDRNYDLIEMRLTGLNPDSYTDETNTTSFADVKVYLCAYIVVGDTTYYMSSGQVSETLVNSVSYNSVNTLN